MNDNPANPRKMASGDSNSHGEPDRTTDSEGRTSNRRRFLLGVGATTALIAGCVSGDDGDGGGDNGNNGGDDTGGGSSTDNGDDSGADDESDTSGDGTGGDSGDDDSSSASGGSGDDGSGTDDGGTDDGSGGNGGDDSGTDDSSGGDGGDDSGGDDGSSASAKFFGSFSWADSFRYEIVEGADGSAGEITFYQGNVYATSEDEQGNTVEVYLIDGQYYIVTGGQCAVYGTPTGRGITEEPTDIDDRESLEGQDPDITQVGTDTIEGDPVTVYEVAAETTYTMYVLDSGYPRRIETDEIVADYSDWGEVEPITPPDEDSDLECSSPGGGDGDGGGYP